MLRRHLKISLALAVVALLAGAAAALAAQSAGPRLSFIEVRLPAKLPKHGGGKQIERGFRLISIDADGKDRGRLFPTRGLAIAGIGTPSWSADGSRVAFMAEPTREVGPAGDQTRLRIYVADSDGSQIKPVPGTIGASDPVLSPDGESVAYDLTKEHRPKFDPNNPKSIIPALEHQYSSTTTWVAPVADGKPRRLTKWQNGRTASPSSFSPDGSLLALTMSTPSARQEVDTVDLATGKLRTVERDAGEAAFSPDGSRIAFTSYRDHGSVPGFDGREGTTELYVAKADGSGARRITHTPDQAEEGPSWDPSGSRLAYLRTPGGLGAFLGLEGEVMESNADGTCPTVVAVPVKLGRGAEAAVQPPAWIPGEGRGAGPLSC